MEENHLPSQVETIFMLFDGWLSKKTTRRLAHRQKTCHAAVRGKYRRFQKKFNQEVPAILLQESFWCAIGGIRGQVCAADD